MENTFFWKFLEKYKFPVGAIVLIFYQFFSSIAVFGFILTLPICMVTIIGLSDTSATSIYHARFGMSYLLQIFGAMFSDQLFGRLKTFLVTYPFDVLLYGSMTIMAIYNKYIGIIIIYFISGLMEAAYSSGIRAFIGDQIESEKKVMLAAYLHVIYFINNLGAIIASFCAPIIHKDIYCYGKECYPLIFLISFLSSAIALTFVLVGHVCNLFKVHPVVENLFGESISCILYALKTRIKEGRKPEGHWMDYAETKYEYQLVHDCKIFLALSFFLVGHPLYWMVFEQMSSIWTLQARYTNGMISEMFTLKADQMQTLNPVFVLIFIPLFELSLYPFFERINVKIPYIIALGQFFAAGACASMIYIQYRIDASLSIPLKVSEIGVNFFNLHDQPVIVYTHGGSFNIAAFKAHEFIFVQNQTIYISIEHFNISTTIGNWDRTYFSAAIFLDNNIGVVRYSQIQIQENGGYGNVRLFDHDTLKIDEVFGFRGKLGINNKVFLPVVSKNFGDYVKCGIGVFDLLYGLNNSIRLATVTVFPAQSITIFKKESRTMQIFIGHDYTVNLPMIYWQIIPYALLTIGEVLFNVNTGIFLYNEAPLSTKSSILAVQYLNKAIGNWLILLFKQSLSNLGMIYLFILCTSLVSISGVITGYLGRNYLANKKIREERLIDKTPVTATNI